MGITSSRNRAGIIQISWDLTSGLYKDANNKKMVKNTNTATATIETFTSTLPIFIKNSMGG
jgi:hypothetical protein